MKKSFSDFVKGSHSLTRLLTRKGNDFPYTLDSYGVWMVKGEDPNADMQGCHSEPYIGTFEGKLRDVVQYAMTLPKFFTWGAGGSFEPITVTKIDANSSRERIELENQRRALQEQMDILNTKLNQVNSKLK